jgi:hypothetical protein
MHNVSPSTRGRESQKELKQNDGQNKGLKTKEGQGEISSSKPGDDNTNIMIK